MLDRIDIQVEVPRSKISILSTPTDNVENSETVIQRVIQARAWQLARADKPNALLENSELSTHCHAEGKQLRLLEMAAD